MYNLIKTITEHMPNISEGGITAQESEGGHRPFYRCLPFVNFLRSCLCYLYVMFYGISFNLVSICSQISFLQKYQYKIVIKQKTLLIFAKELSARKSHFVIGLITGVFR